MVGIGLGAGGVGSSPLARGTRLILMIAALLARLIPARAGNTLALRCAIRASPAHPRSRGEHPTNALPSECVAGSSPLARGTQQTVTSARKWSRLIPARAGNTLLQSGASVSRPAHPRSRGEHASAQRALRHAHGSSPLARGTQPGTPAGKSHARLIPARAGNTSKRYHGLAW